jgi:hypothetical protein
MNSVNSLSHIHWQPSAARGALLVLTVVLAGCGQNDVQVYRVAKDQPQPQSQMDAGMMPPGHPDTSGAMPPGHPDTSGVLPRLQWKLPDGWQEAAPGEMRAASFRVAGKDGKQADVGVVPLPGLAGHDLENVNRWRATVGLQAVKEEDLAKLAQPVEVGGQAAQLYEQAGENAGSGDKTRILAAVLRREGVAWFFKMAGDDELVAQQKPAFIGLLKSISFQETGTQGGLPPSHPPIDSGMMMPAMSVPQASTGQGKPDWQVPAGWQEVAGGQFLVAKFVISGADNAQAAVNVSVSGGAGGGLLANVNRWRGQLGLAPWSESDLSQQTRSLEVSSGKATLVDMTGTDARTSQKARVIGAIVSQAGQTWFYKLMGNTDIVEKQKEALAQFVQSAKYP